MTPRVNEGPVSLLEIMKIISEEFLKFLYMVEFLNAPLYLFIQKFHLKKDALISRTLKVILRPFSLKVVNFY